MINNQTEWALRTSLINPNIRENFRSTLKSFPFSLKWRFRNNVMSKGVGNVVCGSMRTGIVVRGVMGVGNVG